MNVPHPDRMWESFLRIGKKAQMQGERSANNPTQEEYATSVSVLRALQTYVVPNVRYLDWYCFLLHDRSGGVPVAEDDDGAFIHLRFEMSPVWVGLPTLWEMSRKMPRPEPFIAMDWLTIGRQSELVLSLVDQFGMRDDKGLYEGVGQHLHYFSNMTQMRIF